MQLCRKFLAILLVAVMCITCIPVTALADTGDADYKTYRITGEYISESKYAVNIENISMEALMVLMNTAKFFSGSVLIAVVDYVNTDEILMYGESWKDGKCIYSTAVAADSDDNVTSKFTSTYGDYTTFTFYLTDKKTIEMVKDWCFVTVTLRSLVGDRNLHYTYSDGSTSEIRLTTDVTMEQSYKSSTPAEPEPVVKKDISELTFGKMSSYAYNGKAKKPNVVVKDGSKTLVKGTDYTLSYKNNTEVGVASVTITGKGDYKGTVTKTFKITPTKSTLKITKQTSEKISFKWTQSKGVEKYYIYMSVDGGKYKKVATIGGAKTGVTIKGYDFDEGRYSFKIRPVAFDGDTTCCGAYSNVVTEKA